MFISYSEFRGEQLFITDEFIANKFCLNIFLTFTAIHSQSIVNTNNYILLSKKTIISKMALDLLGSDQ